MYRKIAVSIPRSQLQSNGRIIPLCQGKELKILKGCAAESDVSLTLGKLGIRDSLNEMGGSKMKKK